MTGMNEFLTDNMRRAYPLDHELPESVKPLWSQLLLDACVATNQELADTRLSLMLVQRELACLDLKIGTPDFYVVARVTPGLPDRATVYASSAEIKALLVVNGRIADKILEDGSYGLTEVDVNVPFAMRCTSSAHRRVESISAYSAGLRQRPVFTDPEHETPVAEITGGDAVIAAKNGVDLETAGLMPLSGKLLRVSAITAPASTSEADEDVDLMIRGDGCFTVEAIPGVKPVGNTGTVEPRTEADDGGVMGGGVIRIGNVCKPCCQCEDYKAAVDAIRDPETLAASIEQVLNNARLQYNAAVTAFNTWKAGAMAAINALTNVQCTAVASLSPPAYYNSTSSGKRERVSITLSVANMTQRNVTVSGLSFTVPNSPGEPAYSLIRVQWTHDSGGAVASGSSETANGATAAMPPGKVLAPGGTLVVAATYSRTSGHNDAVRPNGMTASLSIAAGSDTLSKTVTVS